MGRWSLAPPTLTSHLAWCEKSRKTGGLGDMKIPLLADKSMAISKAYGVLKEDEGLSFRGLFIIDPSQKLRLVQAFQFTDEHGEVCPAGWKPGKATMKAD